MKVELYYFNDCPSHQTASANLQAALRAEGLPENIEMIEVTSEQDAQKMRFVGSPTIRIDGVDLEGAEAEGKGYGFGCRVYSENGSMAGWPSVEQIRSALRRRNGSREEVSLRDLFDVELQYRPGIGPVTTKEGREGKRLGGGDGVVRGPQIQGKARWDIYEKTGQGRCEFNIAGFIETNDNASVAFETTGYGLVPTADEPSQWSMVAAVRFSAADKSYEALNSTVATWAGEFDMNTGQHRYRTVTVRTREGKQASAETEGAHSCCH